MTHHRLTQSSTLIATLGTEPQVVTAALDLLSQRGECISRLQVLHTLSTDPALAGSLHALRQAFTPPPAGLQVEFFPITTLEGQPLADIETPASAEAGFRALYRLVRQAKRRLEKVHLSIAGGRKLLSLYGMLAAQILFDDEDCLWYLHSAGQFLAEKRLHPAAGDETRLVPIPVVRWARISPVLLDLSDSDDPYQALQRQAALRLEERLEEARSFVRGALTPAEEKVVAQLVKEGLSDAEIAGRLGISPRTVGDHLGVAYQKAAAHWNLENVGRTQLVQLLYFYYLGKSPGNP